MDNNGLFPGAKFDLVVLAASAGGVPTILDLMSLIPGNFPVPILLVQHLARDHPSRLAEILARKTELKVREARDGDVIAASSLYVAPPDQHLTVSPKGLLSLSQTPPVHFQRPSADTLLESAAKAFGTRMVAVVLSGMGSDGADGIREVKKHGGTVIAEDPKEALFPGMPEAAIQTGAVDMILLLKDIGPKLVELVCYEGT